MVGRRIGYSLFTLAVWAAFIWTENSVALFVGLLLTILPLCTLVLLLIAKRSVRFDCEVGETCMRGSSLKMQMKVGVRPAFFVGSAEVGVTIQNSTFGSVQNKIFVFHDLSFSPVGYDYLDKNSGRIRMDVDEIKLVDFLGLCSVTAKTHFSFESIVSPVLYDGLQLSVGLGSDYAAIGERVDVNHKGSDRSEIFAVRDYVDGDSMNAVHWKLSTKFDELKVKDFAGAGDYKVLILVDLSRIKYGKTATDEALNKVLDIAVSISNYLWGISVYHCVGWVDKGELRYVGVSDYETFMMMVHSLMSAKVTEQDVRAVNFMSSEEHTIRFTKFLFVSTGAQPEDVQYLNGEVTAISVSDHDEVYNADNVRMIDLKPDFVETALVNGLL